MGKRIYDINIIWDKLVKIWAAGFFVIKESYFLFKINSKENKYKERYCVFLLNMQGVLFYWDCFRIPFCPKFSDCGQSFQNFFLA